MIYGLQIFFYYVFFGRWLPWYGISVPYLGIEPKVIGKRKKKRALQCILKIMIVLQDSQLPEDSIQDMAHDLLKALQ